MRITDISVAKLFGIFDYTIPLNLDDRITIIHGPNGCGKTIILEMINGLFTGRYSGLLSVPFRRFEVRFDDDSVVWIAKADQEFTQGQDATGQGSKGDSPETTLNYLKLSMADPLSFPLNPSIDIETPRFNRASSGRLPLSFYYASLVSNEFGKSEKVDVPDWWNEVRESVDIRLIRTQRLQNIRESIKESKLYFVTDLYGEKETVAVPAVNEYAEELKEFIQQRLAESASLSQSLDRTFPSRLVEQVRDPNRSKLTNEELRTKLGELDKKRSRLIEAGLLDKEEGVASLPIEEITSDTKDVLAIYMKDMEKKLSLFDEIAGKIDLFKKMIDRRRFLHKEIVISKEAGFMFATQDGQTLPLTVLSSGEQHELVLLYQLLFKANPNSLILIDEPEISLHVAWQQEFLRDLQEITRLSSFDVLIATHSPQIIHDRWDLTVRLEGPAI